jgi:D-alanine-D-alanine ligase
MKTTVAVFFGGRSVEHEVSIISGIQALSALNNSKYNALPVYISKDNILYTGEHMGDIESYKDMEECLRKATRVIPVAQDGRVALLRYPAKKLGNNLISVFDIAMPVVHGTNAEDGTLMGFLEMLGIPYTGCDVLSSAVGMDKYAMKAVLRQAGLPVLDALMFTSKQFSVDEEQIINKIESKFDYPVIVKPVNLGSSVGISLAGNRKQLKKSMDNAFEFSLRVLVEQAVQNLREINCSVVGDIDSAESSVCEEPISSNEILDYSDKYLSNAGEAGGKKSGMSSLKRKLPADIPSELEVKVRELAVKTFQALGCSGVARIDFLNNKETGELYINEINTIPGSLSFYLWDATGINFANLLDRMIELGLKRHRERQSITFTYNTNILSGVSLGGAKGVKGKA